MLGMCSRCGIRPTICGYVFCRSCVRQDDLLWQPIVDIVADRARFLTKTRDCALCDGPTGIDNGDVAVADFRVCLLCALRARELVSFDD